MMHFTDVSSRPRRDTNEESSSSSSGRKPFFPRLFGRNAELDELKRECDTVCLSFLHGSDDFNHRSPLVLLLTGRSGCGKTALVHEFGYRIMDETPQGIDSSNKSTAAASSRTEDFTTPREQRRVVFVSGKVDQFQRHLPYAPIIQALDEIGRILLQQIPGSSDTASDVVADLEYVRDLKAIRRLLRREGKTLVQLVPNLSRFMEMGMLENDSSEEESLEKNEAAASNTEKTEEVPLLDSTNESSNNKGITERLICLAVQSFVRIFVRIHPLVWFVDDLQWADTSSLRVLRALVADHQLGHLLFVMGCRDLLTASTASSTNNNSGGEDEHQVALSSFWASTDRKVEMSLDNLQVPVLTEWLAHLLSTDSSKVRPLAEVVHSKTDGNPYFCLNYLELLQRKQLLRYRYQAGTWDWNLDDIMEPPLPRQRETIGDGRGSCPNRSSLNPGSLNEMVAMQIASLPRLAQQLLQVASCLGFYFDETLLKDLIQTCDSLLLMGFSQSLALCTLDYVEDNSDDLDCLNPQDECSEDNEEANRAYLNALYKAEEEGLIRQTRDPKIYQFTHDRVQQILYKSMANGKEIALLHLRIGQYIKELDDEHYILDAAEQLNRGSLLLVHEMERLELIELNLKVSTHARKRGGIILMTNYLEKAVSLVKERDWTRSYDLVLEVFNRSAEAEATRGRLPKSEECIAAILSNAKTPDDTIRARYVRMVNLGMRGRLRQALREARKLLRELGERLPPSNPISFLIEYKRARRSLRDLTDADLESLTPVTDTTKLWIAKIMRDAGKFGWSCDPTFSLFIYMRLVNQALRNGICESTPLAFSVYGSIAATMGHEEEGIRFADLSLRLVKEKSGLPAVTMGVYASLMHLKQPFRYSLKPLLSAYRIGLETGDTYYGAMVHALYLLICHLCGCPLGPFAESLRTFVSQLQLCGRGIPLSYAILSLRMVLSLRGDTSDSSLHASLDACKNEDIFSEDLTPAENPTLMNTFRHYLQAFYAYVLGDLESAEKYVKEANFARFVGGHVGNIFHAFIDGLVYLALYRKTGQRRYLRNATRVTKFIGTLAGKQPRNCAGMLFLLKAEQESTGRAKDRERITKQYDDAIKAFDEEGFLHFGAIANERAGEFRARCGERSRQRIYVAAALSLYKDWGATTKVKALEDKYAMSCALKCKQREKGPHSSVRTSDPSGLTSRTSVASSFTHSFL